MNSKLQSLVELQKLDLRILDIQTQQQKIPEQIKAAEPPLLEATKRRAVVTAEVETLVKARRDSEQELAGQEAHIQKLKTRLTDLKTNKEYQAHLFEIELANKKKDTLEENVLTVLEQVEEKQKEADQLQALAADVEREFTQQTAQLESLVETLTNELELLHQQQREALVVLDQNLHDRYTRLKSTRGEPVVVPVRGGACQGCQLQLPPQLVAEVKRAEELLTCSYCYRILYWEGGVEGAGGLAETPGEEGIEEKV